MPCIAGLIALVPMAVFVWMLAKVRPPSAADVAQRSARAPMDAHQRWQFFRAHALGLIALVVMFVLITVLRSIRSDYAAEIWSGLLGEKVATPPQVFTSSEIVVALMVMVGNGLCFLIKDNRRAFFAGLAIGGFGTALVVAAVAGLHFGLLDGFAFMVLAGIGLYLPYVAIHTTIFERLIAMTRDRGNLGYLMYLADSFGYLGYGLFMLFGKPLFGRSDIQYLFALNFFAGTSLVMALISLACIILAATYFRDLGVKAVGKVLVPTLTECPSAITLPASAAIGEK